MEAAEAQQQGTGGSGKLLAGNYWDVRSSADGLNFLQKGEGEEAWGPATGLTLVSSSFPFSLDHLLQLLSTDFFRLVSPSLASFAPLLTVALRFRPSVPAQGLTQRVFHKPLQQLLRLAGQKVLVSFYK